MRRRGSEEGPCELLAQRHVHVHPEKRVEGCGDLCLRSACGRLVERCGVDPVRARCTSGPEERVERHVTVLRDARQQRAGHDAQDLQPREVQRHDLRCRTGLFPLQRELLLP